MEEQGLDMPHGDNSCYRVIATATTTLPLDAFCYCYYYSVLLSLSVSVAVTSPPHTGDGVIETCHSNSHV